MRVIESGAARPRLPRALAVIVCGFVLGNLAALSITGVRMGGDSLQYTSGAVQLLAGRALDLTQSAHVGYVLAIALCQVVGAGLIGLVLLQIAVGAVAVIAIYRLGLALSSPVAGLIAAGLLAADVETARWHAFVLTDSFFISLLAISVWRVHEVVTGGPSGWRRYLAAAVPLLLVALMRPQGWLTVLLAATYWAIAQAPGSGWRGIAWALAAVALLIALFVPTLLGSLDRAVVGSLVHGRTMWGSDRWTIEMPAPDPGASPRSVTSAAQYALDHPAKAATLMLARVGVHFAHVRPFYSIAHDVLIVLWLAPVYLFALRGWRTISGVPLARLLLGIIAAQAGLVAITHADWDGRYLAYVLPLIYVITGCGAEGTRAGRGREASADAWHRSTLTDLRSRGSREAQP